MPVRAQLTGQTFGRLTVLGSTGVDRNGKLLWHCLCECGNTTETTSSNLKSGNSTSCGCLRRDSCKTHGRHGTAEYKAWRNLLARCHNPNCTQYHDYGGRGISVDPRWTDFPTFYSDMGARPSPAHSIDRRDNNKGYGPDNCHWATPTDQQRNRRNNHILDTPKGKMTIAEAAEVYGMKYATLRNRVSKYGWDLARALTEPVHTKRSSK